MKSTPNSTHLYGKEEHHRIMAFVAETMGLLYNENDTEQNNDFRIESIKQIMKRLNDIARVSVGLMYELVQADQSLDQCKMFWKNVPGAYKKKALRSFIDAAVLGGIPLDRSEQDWAPFIILTRRYRNIYHPVVKEV